MDFILTGLFVLIFCALVIGVVVGIGVLGLLLYNLLFGGEYGEYKSSCSQNAKHEENP